MAGETPTWRPPNRIRAVAIGIARRENRILAVEVLADDGSVKGWRPPGGGIEYGEPAVAALKRELMEELDSEIAVEGQPAVFENIFEHQGALGHEIVFVYPVKFLNKRVFERDRFIVKEDKGTSHWAEWVELDRFKSGEQVLFPLALLTHIVSN